MTAAHRAGVTFGSAPVFVDVSGRRRRALTLLGYLGAAACAAYVAAFGVTMTTSAGALHAVAGATLTPTPLPSDDDGDDGDGPQAAALPDVRIPAVAPRSGRIGRRGRGGPSGGRGARARDGVGDAGPHEARGAPAARAERPPRTPRHGPP